ncbi:MAG: 5'-nucleotidase C-terminal domain-containing protein [Caldisericota bacterium]|nr:5'-nucleotidase C-terminal domain-containing protein [Caldisericota bacterium]
MKESKIAKNLLISLIIVVMVFSITMFSGFIPRLQKVTILTTSDFQSQIAPYTTKVVIGGEQQKIEVGGAARVAGLVKYLKKRNGNASTLFLTSGDDFIGPVFRAFGGIPTTFLWDQIATAWCLGNHEFDLGPETLGNALDYATMPVLGANMDVSQEPALAGKVQPDMIKMVGNIKIGIFGLMTPNLPIISSVGKVTVDGDLEAIARSEVAKLKSQGADIIIAVTHIGLDVDKDIASKVDGIDVIVGGHSHTLMEVPAEVVTPNGGTTIIVQDGAKAAYLGELNLYIGRRGIDHFKWNLHLLDENVPTDPFTEKMVDYFMNQMPPPEKVGESLIDLDARKITVRKMEAEIGNLFTDAMCESVGTKIAVTNGGGIRGDKIYPKGEITTATITEMHPFGNSIVVVNLTGAQLKEVLERGAAALRSVNDPRDPSTIGSGSFLQIAGLKITIDISKTPQQLSSDNTSIVVPGERVTEVLVNGEPLNMDKIYEVAVNDFIAAGGDGYLTLKNLPDADKDFTYVYLTDALSRYIENHTPISPEVEGRITILGE